MKRYIIIALTDETVFHRKVVLLHKIRSCCYSSSDFAFKVFVPQIITVTEFSILCVELVLTQLQLMDDLSQVLPNIARR